MDECRRVECNEWVVIAMVIACRYSIGGAPELRSIRMEDFLLAKETLRVSTAMDTPARESMMRWHGRFGEGGANTSPSNIGF